MAPPRWAASLVRDTIHDAFMSGPEHVVELAHGYTYSAHPLACAAGLATLDIYRDEKLFERAHELEPKFADAVHVAAERACAWWISAPSA